MNNFRSEKTFYIDLFNGKRQSVLIDFTGGRRSALTANKPGYYRITHEDFLELCDGICQERHESHWHWTHSPKSTEAWDYSPHGIAVACDTKGIDYWFIKSKTFIKWIKRNSPIIFDEGRNMKIGYEVLIKYGRRARVEVAQYTISHIDKPNPNAAIIEGCPNQDLFTITDRQIIWSTDPSRYQTKPQKWFIQRYDVFFDKTEIKKRVQKAINEVISDLEERNKLIQERYTQILKNKKDRALDLLSSQSNPISGDNDHTTTKTSYISPFTGKQC